MVFCVPGSIKINVNTARGLQHPALKPRAFADVAVRRLCAAAAPTSAPDV
jgi:hypothetical protein